jgi:hypothetical protein
MGPTGTGKVISIAPSWYVNSSLSQYSRKIFTKIPNDHKLTFSLNAKFIKLLAKDDDNIRIGHGIQSETIDIKTASYSESGREVTLVDTPGFDDSREGVTDTNILGKIANFLQEG